MFSEEQASFISDKTGLSDLGVLVGRVKQCGFDGAAYVAANADLQEAGLDQSSAFFHLLAHGVDEQRDVPGDTLSKGLPELAALAIPDKAYARRLFRTVVPAWTKDDGFDGPGAVGRSKRLLHELFRSAVREVGPRRHRFGAP